MSYEDKVLLGSFISLAAIVLLLDLLKVIWFFPIICYTFIQYRKSMSHEDKIVFYSFIAVYMIAIILAMFNIAYQGIFVFLNAETRS